MAALASLHDLKIESKLKTLRDLKAGFPVSNTGDLLLPGNIVSITSLLTLTLPLIRTLDYDYQL